MRMLTNAAWYSPEVPPTPSNSESADFAERLKSARAGSCPDLGWIQEWLRPRLARFVSASMGGSARRDISVADVEQEVLGNASEWLQHLREEAGPEDVCALAIQQARWTLGKVYRRSAQALGESAVAPRGLDALAHREDETGAVTSADEEQHLESLIYALPTRLMDVVLWRREGRTFTEIGGELGLGEDAARKRFLQAAELIRVRIGEGPAVGE